MSDYISKTQIALTLLLWAVLLLALWYSSEHGNGVGDYPHYQLNPSYPNYPSQVTVQVVAQG